MLLVKLCQPLFGDIHISTAKFAAVCNVDCVGISVVEILKSYIILLIGKGKNN